MSLDVSLLGEAKEEPCICCGCGNEHTKTVRECFYDANITHNLNRMAEAAGIYKHLWRPEEISITHAKQLIEPLSEGLELLESDPAKFGGYNAENGWGVYENFVAFVRGYLEACKEYPEASVEVSR